MKKILLTSPKGYAQRLIWAFAEVTEQTDICPVSIPMIQTDILPDSEGMKEFLSQLSAYDYLAFSSRKAIESLAAAIQSTGITLPTCLQLCAIGKDNEGVREMLHREPAFISEEPSPAGIVKHLSTLPSIEGKRIGVLAPVVTGMREPDIVPNFLEGLNRIGMKTDRITAYQTKACATETLNRLRTEILNEDYHSVLFTSGTEIKVFLRMAAEGCQTSPSATMEEMPDTESIHHLLKHLQVHCYGPYTASVATQLGIAVDFVSPSFGSFQELVSELQKYENK